MSTTPIDSWAVDLADVTSIYPWVGSEGFMAVVAIALWIVWHIWQLRHENATIEAEMQKHGQSEAIRKALSGD